MASWQESCSYRPYVLAIALISSIILSRHSFSTSSYPLILARFCVNKFLHCRLNLHASYILATNEPCAILLPSVYSFCILVPGHLLYISLLRNASKGLKVSLNKYIYPHGMHVVRVGPCFRLADMWHGKRLRWMLGVVVRLTSQQLATVCTGAKVPWHQRARMRPPRIAQSEALRTCSDTTFAGCSRSKLIPRKSQRS